MATVGQRGAKPPTIYMRPKLGMDTEILLRKDHSIRLENMNYEGENIISYKKSRVQKYMTLFIDFLSSLIPKKLGIKR